MKKSIAQIFFIFILYLGNSVLGNTSNPQLSHLQATENYLSPKPAPGSIAKAKQILKKYTVMLIKIIITAFAIIIGMVIYWRQFKNHTMTHLDNTGQEELLLHKGRKTNQKRESSPINHINTRESSDEKIVKSNRGEQESSMITNKPTRINESYDVPNHTEYYEAKQNGSFGAINEKKKLKIVTKRKAKKAKKIQALQPLNNTLSPYQGNQNNRLSTIYEGKELKATKNELARMQQEYESGNASYQISQNSTLPTRDQQVPKVVDSWLDNIFAIDLHYKYIYYLNLLYQAAQNNHLPTGIISQLFQEEQLLKKYYALWKIIIVKEGQLEERSQFRAFLNQFILCTADGKTTNTKFLSQNDQKLKFISLLNRERHNTKQSMVKAIDNLLVPKKLIQNRKRRNDPARKKIKQQLDQMLYDISKGIYNYMSKYIEDLHDQVQAIVVEEGNIDLGALLREDIEKSIYVICKNKWKIIAQDIQKSIPQQLINTFLKPIQIDNKQYPVNSWLNEAAKEELQYFVDELIIVFTCPLLSREQKVIIDKGSACFKPNNKKIIIPKNLNDYSQLGLTEEEIGAIETALELHKDLNWPLLYVAVV